LVPLTVSEEMTLDTVLGVTMRLSIEWVGAGTPTLCIWRLGDAAWEKAREGAPSKPVHRLAKSKPVCFWVPA
jgi:hypothetical protein